MHRKTKVIPTTNSHLVSSGQMSSAGRENQDKSKEMTTINSKSTGETGLQQPNDPQDVEFSYNSDSSADVALAAKVVPSLTVTFSTETLLALDIKYQFITHKLTQLVSSMMSSENFSQMANSSPPEVDSVTFGKLFSNLKIKTYADIMEHIPRKFHITKGNGNKKISELWDLIYISEPLLSDSIAALIINFASASYVATLVSCSFVRERQILMAIVKIFTFVPHSRSAFHGARIHLTFFWECQI